MNTRNLPRKLRIALLAGGKSGEREVSLNGAREVWHAFDKSKYDITQYDPATDLAQLVHDAKVIDVAFILLHGVLGEDGTIQGFLDLLGIPYQGSGVMGSAMAMNKHIAKIQYRQAGLTIPRWVVLREGEDFKTIDSFMAELSFPVIVKPVNQGSSLGMTLARDRNEIEIGLRKAFEVDTEVLIEEFINGREITVGVLGNEELTALPVVEIIPGEAYSFFDFEAKYIPGATREVCPAPLDQELTSQAQKYGLMAHQALCLRGYSRTDMIIAGGKMYVLETNTIPGMTPTSLFPQAAAAYGLSFSDLLDRLIELALH